MQRIESSDGMTMSSEKDFARNLQAQVKAWMSEKPGGCRTNDGGVFVVRRRRAKASFRGS
jgi:hypothetical protein